MSSTGSSPRQPSGASTRTKRTRAQSHPTYASAARTSAALAQSMRAQNAPAQHFGSYTQSALGADLLRARWDVDFFCERFLGFKPHPGQSRLFRAYILRDETRWQARYLTICAAAGNRAGKTLGLAVIILHATMFKMGKKPPNPLDERDVERWSRLGFEHYHFAIHSEVGELVFYEITRLLSGTHEAQHKGCPLTELLGTAIADWSKKYRGEYQMIVLSPLLGGGIVHFRTTGERAMGSLGKDMDSLSFDEAAFEPHFAFVVDEVLHMRRLSTGGQFILIGTMTEGLTDFADKWNEGDPANPEKKIDSYSVRISTRENIGFGITQDMFDRIVADMPAHLIPQNIDGFAIEARDAFFGSQSVDEAFVADLPVVEAAVRGHHYVQGVDPALTYDSTWSINLDVTDGAAWRGVHAEALGGRQTALSVTSTATNNHMSYHDPERNISCATGIDATGFGGKMFRDLMPIPVKMIEFGGVRMKKLGLLNELKKALETHRLVLPRTGIWLRLRRQLLGYKLDDRKIEQDAVMALAVAVHMAKRVGGGTASQVAFDVFGGVASAPDQNAMLAHLAALAAGQRD